MSAAGAGVPAVGGTSDAVVSMPIPNSDGVIGDVMMVRFFLRLCKVSW